MKQEITEEMIAGFSARFRADGKNAIRQRAVVNSGIDAAAENHRAAIENPMVFSLEVENTGKITNQKSTGRCWLFAALNAMRCETIRSLRLEDFELSETYLMFWDKLEKANYFLNNIAATAREPIDGRLLCHFLDHPVSDGGQWDLYVALAQKYGCVPKSAMPETFHSSDSQAMNALLGCKLREDADELRRAIRDGGREPERLKVEMLREIYAFLAICLGEPPADFSFEYRDKDNVFHRMAPLTPKAFFERCVGLDLEDYVSVVNVPDRPYGKTYTVAFLGNVAGGHPLRYLNLPAAELRRMAVAQLRDGSPVWFGCDVAYMTSRGSGVMDAAAYDYEGTTGLRLRFDKAQRFRHRMLFLTHAMLLTGVNLVGDRPNRWKVENSWGKEKGQDGYFVMSDRWFDEYAYQVVVRKKHLSAEQLAALGEAPTVLDRWDPIACLAE